MMKSKVVSTRARLRVFNQAGITHLPPITLLSPLKTLVKLLTTTSAPGSTSTLTNPAIVSSMTIIAPKSSASFLSSLRGGVRNKGFEGNSQKMARMGGTEVDNNSRRAGRSERSPCPKNSQPGPHFCRILRVSV